MTRQATEAQTSIGLVFYNVFDKKALQQADAGLDDLDVMIGAVSEVAIAALELAAGDAELGKRALYELTADEARRDNGYRRKFIVAAVREAVS